MTDNPLLSSTRQAEDADAALRPKSLDEFVGQAAAKDNLRVFIESARQRREAMDHVLFFGPPGLGKTTLAQIVAKELGVGFRATSGPVIAKAGDLAALLTNLEEGDVLFIDEIHRLNPQVEQGERNYQVMGDVLLDYRNYLELEIEVLRGRQRYECKTNWKISGENFAGDTYHLPYSHGSIAATSSLSSGLAAAKASTDTIAARTAAAACTRKTTRRATSAAARAPDGHDGSGAGGGDASGAAAAAAPFVVGGRLVRVAPARDGRQLIGCDHRPGRVGRARLQVAAVDRVRERRQRHGRAGVARPRGLDRVHRRLD